ncbi:MAG: TatD family deoxyribonuclease [Syntrophobacterales bacterium]|nr:MAG: TatD family deoxyribonuclease [Syntrophobacterales bacterium]
MLVDSHAHLEMDEFDGDREKVIQRAQESGVNCIVTVGLNLPDSRKAVALAESYDMIYASVGVHPHDVKNIDETTYDLLRELSKNKKVVAYGEIGLDFFRNLSPKDLQIRRFGEQLELAAELALPVIIHDREAHSETVEMLKGRGEGRGGVIHCFSGDYDMAVRCIDMGFYISIPGTITYRKSEELREIVKKLPIDRLLVETDCPFLSPEPKRGKRNEPAYVAHTARRIAQIKNLPFEEVERMTSQNASDVFGMKTESL